MTSTPFFSESQMAAIRSVAEHGMQTEITIRRRSVQFLNETITSDDFGDDVVTYTPTTSSGLTRKAYGWLFSTPSIVADDDSGALVTTNTYRLFVPVNTDIVAGDEIVVHGQEYIVSDTNAESTLRPLLRCNLRRRE